MTSTDLPMSDLTAQGDRAFKDYETLRAQGRSLDLTRGKPALEQLDISRELLTLPGDRWTASDGTDCRNYGGLKGLPELREIFAPVLQVPAERLLAVGNSSLELMHDCLVHALLSEVPGAARRWVDDERIAFLCPVPGYDRHFALCERFGMELISVPMTDEGPDMDVVERLVATDPAVKGIWCVPKYSNPTGVSYSDEVVERLASMPTAAPDFRIFWDNAYAVHHLTDEEVEIRDVLAASEAHGHPDRPLVFGSTSKITFAGAGVGFFGASQSNVDWLISKSSKRSIGPDKLNQLRHALFLQDSEGVRAHMLKQRALLQPKFELVQQILERELGGTGLARWTSPKGGYFITLQLVHGGASEVVRLAGEAGTALTPAGATHPYGVDPDDATIRIAPSYPSIEDLEHAVVSLAVCVRLVGYEQLLAQ
ncbi:aminotransferase class I/II-fold pyridoxal phosphate-dependent enzyme [Streptomyces sp. SBST2-5]|uniref:Aminotransferase class I/II-fold pyridoxal phosphate-dependent enzyme n=1 Tax=Streptomyces composti TaxID=2720025 RepID=A0ABX1AH48_9ACTN|nr:aminotransferase class I/II-fold pyridoxal phosphate-dependent enzyme [Streptomyces composti]NJP53979.1 aminotransferase class I/II-fold pyridoxal phosphate-dependent enzyme [Streptomyces composti]